MASLCIYLLFLIVVSKVTSQNNQNTVIEITNCFQIFMLDSQHKFHYNGTFLAISNQDSNSATFASQLIHPTVECVFTFEAPVGSQIHARMQNLQMGIRSQFRFFQARQAQCFNGAIRLYDVVEGGEMPLLVEACDTSPIIPERSSTFNTIVITATAGDSVFDFEVDVKESSNKQEPDNNIDELNMSSIVDNNNDNAMNSGPYPSNNSSNSEVEINMKPTMPTTKPSGNTTMPPSSTSPTKVPLISTTEEITSDLGIPTPLGPNSNNPESVASAIPITENLDMENVLSIPPLKSELINENMSMEESDIIETTSESITTTELEDETEMTQGPSTSSTNELLEQESIIKITNEMINITQSLTENDEEEDSESVSSGLGEEEDNLNQILSNNSKLMEPMAGSLVGKRDRPSSHNRYSLLPKRVDISGDQKTPFKYHLVIGQSQKNLKANSLDKAPSALFRKAQEIYI